jgi:hypothetical protein
MDRRRPLLEISIVLGLIALVGALATLQYRWLGQVSDAERARLHVSLEQRANEFATDLDREITRTYTRFQSAGILLTQGRCEWLRDSVRRVVAFATSAAGPRCLPTDERPRPRAVPPRRSAVRSCGLAAGVAAASV